MNTSPSIAALAEALSKAQGEITFAAKGAANPFFRSKYADLASVWDAIRPALSKHGLSIVQNVETVQGASPVLVSVETILLHSSGEWSRSTLDVPVIPSVVEKGQPAMVTPQGIGSAITYARRYALASIVGVAQADDDGNSASGKVSPEPERMSESARANHQAAIEGADTLEALKTVWQLAVKACGDDQDALRHLTTVKDAMKAKLTPPPRKQAKGPNPFGSDQEEADYAGHDLPAKAKA
jgi:hypothetical protein